MFLLASLVFCSCDATRRMPYSQSEPPSRTHACRSYNCFGCKCHGPWAVTSLGGRRRLIIIHSDSVKAKATLIFFSIVVRCTNEGVGAHIWCWNPLLKLPFFARPIKWNILILGRQSDMHLHFCNFFQVREWNSGFVVMLTIFVQVPGATQRSHEPM